MDRAEAQAICDAMTPEQRSWAQKRAREIFRKVRLRGWELGAPSSEKRRDSENVYFIQRGRLGPIKIGIAADPHVRLKALQTGCAERLRLLAVTDGGAEMERQLHREFAADRLQGEWFQPTGRLKERIAELHDSRRALNRAPASRE